jgi:hypothetical protein
VTKRSRILLGTAAAALVIFEVAVLADKLGRLRWFWPYDDAVFGAGIFIGVVGAFLLHAGTAPILEEYRARTEREDSEYK